ncbi:hypothetical protein VP01_274g3 [Puccinia sorghi]|uniref:C2H2-type domain-containing protein n=1 Tax=Puccinia sorghi TaxID=27349 RepID=A0A0L6V319_9BASI|nr:hypothetical protein VP01_274g3 [Puccinia sorghi]
MSYSPYAQHFSAHQLNNSTSSHRFRCEQCKQDYYNLIDLSVHLRNHAKCDYENCKFEALPDILDLHREDRHLIFKPGREPKPKSNPKPDGPLNATIQGLGYALKTQEQIDHWIQERKKKWPTKAVVAQKLAQAEEKKKQILHQTANNYKNNHHNRRHVWVRNDQSGSAQASLQKSTGPDHLNRPPPKQTRNGSAHNRRDRNSSSTHSFLDRSGLFSKLIEKDVQQDVSDIHEVIQFLSRNSFLEGFHLKIDHPLDSYPRIEEVLP